MALLDGVLINCLILLLYGLMYYKLYIQSRTMTNSRSISKVASFNKNRNRQQILALHLGSSAFLIFLCYLTVGIVSILTALAPENDPWMYRKIWCIVNDVLCTCNAPIILLLNKPLRTYFCSTITGRDVSTKPKVIEIAPRTTSQPLPSPTRLSAEN